MCSCWRNSLEWIVSRCFCKCLVWKHLHIVRDTREGVVQAWFFWLPLLWSSIQTSFIGCWWFKWHHTNTVATNTWERSDGLVLEFGTTQLWQGFSLILIQSSQYFVGLWPWPWSSISLDRPAVFSGLGLSGLDDFFVLNTMKRTGLTNVVPVGTR